MTEENGGKKNDLITVLSPFQLLFMETLRTTKSSLSKAAASARVSECDQMCLRFESFKMLQLRRECKKRGISPKGTRGEVLERLQALIRSYTAVRAGKAENCTPVNDADQPAKLIRSFVMPVGGGADFKPSGG